MTRTIRTRTTPRAALAACGIVVLAAGCTATGGDGANGATEDGTSDGAEDTATEDGAAPGTTELTVVTHDSFDLGEGLVESFESETGYEVTFVAPGDGGALVNQLILTAEAPLGDVVYGIDNTFAARAVEAGVLEPYASEAAAAGFDDFDGHLTAVDFGDVCLNADIEWFADAGLDIPQTFEDLTAPEYADLLVVTNPATSSPGLALLAATVGAFGEDGWQDFWRDLTANGLHVVQGWSDAYFVDFSTNDTGSYPLVLSYSSSPAAEVGEDGETSRTVALLDTCFRQVEYAGVVAGGNNPEGAQAFVDFLLSQEVQTDIPGSMYMYPVSDDAELPAEWEAHAPIAENPHEVAPEVIDENREDWIETWTEIVLG